MMRRIAFIFFIAVAIGSAGCKKHGMNSSTNQNTSAVVVTPTPVVNVAANSALINAARAGDAAKVNSLLSDGADPNARDDGGRTPLTEAAYGGKLEIVKTLLAAGADPSLKKSDGATAITLSGNQPDITQLFKSVDALVAAASSGDNKTVSAQLARHVPIDAKDEAGHTALTEAAWNGQTETVKLLLENGANPGMKKSDGATALSLATGQKHQDIVDLLSKAPLQSTTPPVSTTTKDQNTNTASGSKPR